MNRGQLSHWWRPGLLLVAVIVTGCVASDNYPVIWIENQTDVTVEISLAQVGATDGFATVWTALDPGKGVSYADVAQGCNDHLELVAEDPAGIVIARTSPVCRPSAWVIEP
jgi:hypothetical protein